MNIKIIELASKVAFITIFNQNKKSRIRTKSIKNENEQ